MTLLMRDQENIEKGMAQGMVQGKIYGAISVYREMGLSNDEILTKIREKFHLTKEKAEGYLMAEVV